MRAADFIPGTGSHRRTWAAVLLLRVPLLLVLLPLSCQRYDFLREEVYEQVGYANEVDLLFIIDNSQSMQEEQAALATNFDRFIQDISAAAQQEKTFPKVTLADAVSNYLFFVNNFGRFIRYRLGTTTTQIDDAGNPALVGVDGLLVPPYPDDSSAPLYLQRDDDDPVTAFRTVVSYVQSHSQAVGEEKGLEAMRRALCMSHPAPETLSREGQVLDCSDILADGLTGANQDFLRDDTALAVVIFSDEGDSSPGDVDQYLSFLDRLDRPYSISAVAPTLPRDTSDITPECNPGGSPYALIERYREATEASNGLLVPICNDFADTLGDLSRLINNLLMRFRLRQIPQEDSILVFVDGVEVSRDDLNGWIYDSGRNSIAFTGSAVPDYSSRIQVYYRALVASDPRPLPF